MKDLTELSEACRAFDHAIAIIKSIGAARRAERRSPVKKEQSTIPWKLVGVLLLDMKGAPTRGIPTTIVSTNKGIQFRPGWKGSPKKIIARFKDAIAALEKEQPLFCLTKWLMTANY